MPSCVFYMYAYMYMYVTLGTDARRTPFIRARTEEVKTGSQACCYYYYYYYYYNSTHNNTTTTTTTNNNRSLHGGLQGLGDVAFQTASCHENTITFFVLVFFSFLSSRDITYYNMISYTTNYIMMYHTIYIYMCMCMCMYTCMCMCMYMYVCIYTCIYLSLSIYIYIHIFVYMYVYI